MGILNILGLRSKKEIKVEPTGPKARVLISVLDVAQIGKKGPINQFSLQEGQDELVIKRDAGHPQSNERKFVVLEGNQILIADNPEMQHISRNQAVLRWNTQSKKYLIEDQSPGGTYVNDEFIQKSRSAVIPHLGRVALGDAERNSPFVLTFVYQKNL